MSNASGCERRATSGRAKGRSAMVESHAGAPRGVDKGSVRPHSHLGRIAGLVQRAQVARVVELALAGHEELVLWTAPALILDVGVYGVRREQWHVLVHVAAHDFEVAVVEVKAEVRRADGLHQPGDALG